MKDTKLNDAAQVGKMFVTRVIFEYHEGGQVYNSDTGEYDNKPGRWEISATLSDRPTKYGNSQNMGVVVEQGVGQKLAEVLLPVVVADASRKAQQLADDSKAMLAALGDRAVACITNMPEAPKE